MNGHHHPMTTLSHFLHRHFLWFLLTAYLLAALVPAPGLWLRNVSFGEISLFGDRTRLSLPMLMLGFLLLNAGLGVQRGELRNLLRSPKILAAGLTANVLVPVLFIFVV